MKSVPTLDESAIRLGTYVTKERMIVKVNGYPFYIPAGTVLTSHPDNIKAAFSDEPWKK